MSWSWIFADGARNLGVSGAAVEVGRESAERPITSALQTSSLSHISAAHHVGLHNEERVDNFVSRRWNIAVKKASPYATWATLSRGHWK